MVAVRVMLEFELGDIDEYSQAQLEQEIATHTHLALLQFHSARALRATVQAANQSGSPQLASWTKIQSVHDAWYDILSNASCNVKVGGAE